MLPKKEIVRRARENGVVDRMNALLSSSYLLICEANNLIEDASDLMREHGMMLGSLKKHHTNLVYHADIYFKDFSSLVTDEGKKMEMFNDLDKFDEMYRKMMGIENGWKPKEII